MVNPETLVLIDLDPVMTLDPTLADAIPARVEAEVAVQGWTQGNLTDQQSVFIALLVTRSFVSRLLLKFSQEIKKTAGGAASVEFADAIKYLDALQKELDARRIEIMFIANPTSIVTADRWPSTGVIAI